MGGTQYSVRSLGGDGGNGWGEGRTWTSSAKPAGHIGAEGILFLDYNGADCSLGTMQYTTSSGSLMVNRTYNVCNYAAYYYSQGKAAVWNGNGYNYYWNPRTVPFLLQ